MRISPIRKNDAAPAEQQELLTSLQQAQDQLSLAYLSFNDAVDPELVDASIFEIRSIQARISYLLRKMKDMHATEGQPWV